MKLLLLIVLIFSLPDVCSSEDNASKFLISKEEIINYEKKELKLQNFIEYRRNRNQYLRFYNFWNNRIYNSKIPTSSEINNIKNRNEDTLYPHIQWEELGPFKKPDNSIAAISGNGRVNVIRFDPLDSLKIWLGSAGGGLWNSSNGGESWNLIVDTEFMSIGVSDILISYDDNDVIYVATGDAAGVPLFRGYSSGLINSADGGETWQRIGDSLMLEDNIVISNIIQHPSIPNTLYISTSNAIKKTTDGGITWVNLKVGEWYRDIKMHPSNPDYLYTSTMSIFDSTFIYRTTNGGANWETLIKLDAVVRTKLAVTPAAPDHIYALSAHQINGKMTEFIYSNDMGDSWQKVSPHIDTLDLVYGQGFYNLSLYVDESDTNKITAGGVFFYRTNDFGNSWINLQTEDIHVDYHDFVYNRYDSSLYIANDGGIYRMNNYNSILHGVQPDFEDLSEGLGITQLYRLGLNHMNDSIFFIGSQDNGTWKYSYGKYIHALGADGMQCFVGNENQNIVYASDQQGHIYKSRDMGNEFEMIFRFHWQERRQWLREFYINPLNSSTIYAGYENIWRKYGDNEWSTLTSFTSKETVSAMAMSPADTNIIMMARQNKLYRSIDNAETFDLILETESAISYIYIDEDEPDEYYICMSGYNDSSKVIIREGDSLFNISYNLPNIPVNSIIKNQMNDDIIIGTDAGVYIFDRFENKWKLPGKGFPRVIVNEVGILYGKRSLYATTFGRGLWKLDLMRCDIDAPIILEKGIFEMCEDSSIEITYQKADPINRYVWSDGRADDTIKVVSQGEYYITAISPEGCIAASKSVKVRTYKKPEIHLLLLSGNPVCKGEPVVLQAELVKQDTSVGESYNFLWSNGDTTLTTYIYESGEYYLEVFSAKGCYYKTQKYEVIINDNPEKPEIRKKGNTLYTDEGSLIRWYLNGKIIKSDELNYIVIDTLGKYQAEVFNENFCSAFSDEISVDIVSKRGIKVDVYPNPFNNVIHIEGYLEEQTQMSYELYDIAGKILLSSDGNDIKGYIFEEVNTAELADGSYFLRINTNLESKIFKIIKNNQ